MRDMFTIILYFFGLLIAIGGLVSIIQFIKSGGTLKGGGENIVKSNISPYTPSVTPPAILDSEEVQHLGEEASRWCMGWMHNSSADHKWLVIEVSRFQMDCRSVYKNPPYNGYPSCTIQLSKEISEESRLPIVQKILDIISVRCPEMISVYGLYLDGTYLILPTNGE